MELTADLSCPPPAVRGGAGGTDLPLILFQSEHADSDPQSCDDEESLPVIQAAYEQLDTTVAENDVTTHPTTTISPNLAAVDHLYVSLQLADWRAGLQALLAQVTELLEDQTFGDLHSSGPALRRTVTERDAPRQTFILGPHHHYQFVILYSRAIGCYSLGPHIIFPLELGKYPHSVFCNCFSLLSFKSCPTLDRTA
jgi:hypothetical protein